MTQARKKAGRPKEGDKKNVSLYIDEDCWKILDKKAQSLGISRSSFVEKVAMSEHLDKDLLRGIIHRLMASREEHLTWVEAHAERLKIRLAEDEAMKVRLQNEIESLQRELDEI